MSTRWSVALTLLSSLLFVATTPAVGAWYVGPVAWAPLLLAIQGRSIPGAAALGWLHGTTTNLLAFFWLVPSLASLDLVSPLGSLAGTVALCVGQGSRAACITALASWLKARRGWPITLTVPLLVVLVEGLVPQVFPWSTAHLAQGNVHWIQLAELGGMANVSFWLAAQAALVTRGISAGAHSTVTERLRWFGAAILVLVGGTLLGGWLLKRTERSLANVGDESALTLGVVQGNVGSVSSRRTDAVAVHRSLSLSLLRDHSNIDLLVWPETVLSSPTAERDLRRLHRDYLSRDRRSSFTAPRIEAALLFGLALRESVDGKPNANPVWNAAALLRPDGTVQGIYRKQVLVPLTERELVPGSASWLPPVSTFVPGPQGQVLEFQGHRVGVSICYEDILPDLIRKSVTEGRAELLINLTSDAWFAGTLGPRLHLMLARFRAVENRRFLVRASIDGVTALIDPVGRITWQLPERQALAGVVRPTWQSIETMYHRVGDLLVTLATLVAVTMAFVRRPGFAQSGAPE